MNRFQDGCCSLFFFCCRRMKRLERRLVKASAEAPWLLAAETGGWVKGERGGGVYRALDACIHVPVGSICVRARWQRKYMEINASSCSPCTSNAALLSGASALRQASSREKRVGSKANETAIAQTHPADP